MDWGVGACVDAYVELPGGELASGYGEGTDGDCGSLISDYADVKGASLGG